MHAGQIYSSKADADKHAGTGTSNLDVVMNLLRRLAGAREKIRSICRGPSG